MIKLIEFVRFLYLCGQGYRYAGISAHPYYGRMTRYGVPEVNVIISRGRSGWEVEQILKEHFELRVEDERCKK